MSEMPPTIAHEFERLHRDESEPWMFGARAAEILRHEWIVETARQMTPNRVVDVGCTVGQLTARLVAELPSVVAIDVSPTAVGHAKRRVGPGAQFLSGSVTALPVGDCRFELAIAADGLYSWNLQVDERRIALAELHRVLVPGGHVILTEHVRPSRFNELVMEVEASALEVVSVSLLYDRPWYQFESWLRAVQRNTLARELRRSLLIARGLRRIGRFIGPSASRHICIIAQRSHAETTRSTRAPQALKLGE